MAKTSHGFGMVNPNTYQPAPVNTPQKSITEEWRPVTLATIKDKNQVVRALTEAVAGKHNPLKNKAIYLRIKPGSTIRVARECKEYETVQVKEDGWDVDQAVIDSIEFVEITDAKVSEAVLEPPLAFISFEKIAVDQDKNPAEGFWFQLKDLEWKLI